MHARPCRAPTWDELADVCIIVVGEFTVAAWVVVAVTGALEVVAMAVIWIVAMVVGVIGTVAVAMAVIWTVAMVVGVIGIVAAVTEMAVAGVVATMADVADGMDAITPDSSTV